MNITDDEWAEVAVAFWLARILEQVRAEWIRRALELE